MKRIVAFILIPVMLFLFCACGKAVEHAANSDAVRFAEQGDFKIFPVG